MHPRLLLPLMLLAPAVARAQETPPIPADQDPVTTGSGLVYSVLKQGDGSAYPVHGDRVRVHYTGWLPDGSVFDSSRQRGVPSEFAVGYVIEGWNEGLSLMSPGARFKLTIPPQLAYGEQGRPGIPANSTLIFDVELLSIPIRTLPYAAWDEGAEVRTAPGGTTYQVLAAGDGASCEGADQVILDFAMFDDEGQAMVSTAMQGAPLIGAPGRFDIPFLDDLTGSLREGEHVLTRVPIDRMKRLAGLPGVDRQDTFLWQVRVVGAYHFEKPAFALPPEEELTATDSGLKYKVLREGFVKRPHSRNTVVAHYAGWLTDGTPFDNSYDRGEPSSFPLNRVIAGWTEGLQLMTTGSKYLFVIPSDLGYGDRGSPPRIPGGSTLVFVVELVDVR